PGSVADFVYYNYFPTVTWNMDSGSPGNLYVYDGWYGYLVVSFDRPGDTLGQSELDELQLTFPSDVLFTGIDYGAGTGAPLTITDPGVFAETSPGFWSTQVPFSFQAPGVYQIQPTYTYAGVSDIQPDGSGSAHVFTVTSPTPAPTAPTPAPTYLPALTLVSQASVCTPINPILDYAEETVTLNIQSSEAGRVLIDRVVLLNEDYLKYTHATPGSADFVVQLTTPLAGYETAPEVFTFTFVPDNGSPSIVLVVTPNPVCQTGTCCTDVGECSNTLAAGCTTGLFQGVGSRCGICDQYVPCAKTMHKCVPYTFQMAAGTSNTAITCVPNGTPCSAIEWPGGEGFVFEQPCDSPNVPLLATCCRYTNTDTGIGFNLNG
ncbi:unnamed protein product, partial [marine sediment metagenome]